MISKYKGNELKYLKKVLKSDTWGSTEGSVTNLFEKKFAERFDFKYGIAMNSGTAALHAALEGVGVGYGDEVIVPALTVIMDTAAIIQAGAIPVYADIDERTFNIDLDDVEKKVTPKTKAIIGVSLYGNESEIEQFDYGIPLIEDNAQHMGESCAEVATYSFENSKHMSCGEGGIALTDNEEIAKKIRLLSNHGFKNSQASEGRTKLNKDIFQSPNYERHSQIGWNYRMSEFSSAIALAQLENLDKFIEQRRDTAYAFSMLLAERSDLFIFQEPVDCHDYWTLAVRFMGGIDNWHKFREKYIANGGDGIYGAWQVSYLEPAMKTGEFKKRNPELYKNINYPSGLCPIAERVQKEIMQFKTNYRNNKILYQKLKALGKTLKEF